MVPRLKRNVRHLLVLLSTFVVLSSVHQLVLIRLQQEMLSSQWYSVRANGTFGLSLDYLQSKRLLIWTNDVHPAPAADVRAFVEPMGVELLEFNLGGPEQCALFNVCDGRKKLKVLTWRSLLVADNIHLRNEFYEVYKYNPVMKLVDAFLCSDVIANCQLYVPFNKTVIILATTRYYTWRVQTPRWRRWTADLQRLAADPRNVIAANSLYDVNYMRYFTGIRPLYIPTYSSYTNASYDPQKPIFVIKIRYEKWLATSFIDSFNGGSCSARVQETPSGYRYADLAKYYGIIHIPYQVSTMSIFEQYRMNIPLFFPSRSLLVKWEVEHWILRERTHPWSVRSPPSPPPHRSQRHLPSPNDAHNESAIDYWMQFADFYTMPHIQYFDSFEQLAQLLCRLTREDLLQISRQMQLYNVELKKRLTDQWEKIVLKIEQYRTIRSN